ncbi:MAG: tetratricopeptide repeat protein [Candidatus Sericytochromatia bacterium]|nr:tetratricopeptide repeat protein [Candidatus Sericytochromatia bacterium]
MRVYRRSYLGLGFAGLMLSACPQSVSQVVNLETPATTVIQLGSAPVSQVTLDESELQSVSLVLNGQDYVLFCLQTADNSESIKALQAGELQAARQQFQVLHDARPDDLRTQLNLATVQLASAQISEGLRQLDTLQARIANPWWLHNNQAVGYLQLGLYEQALASLNDAVRLQADTAEPYFHRGLMHLRLQELPRALESFDFALARNPRHVASQAYRGHVQARMGQAESALDTLSTVIQRDNAFAPAYLFRGLVYLAQNQLDQALADFDRALELRPDDPEALLNRSLAHIRRNDLVQGAQDVTRSLGQLQGPVQQAQQAFVYENLAWIHLLQQDWQRAAELAQQALAQEPESISARINLAHALLYQGQRASALATYQAVLGRRVEGRPVQDIIQGDWVLFRQRNFPATDWLDLARELGLSALPKVLLPAAPIPDLLAEPLPVASALPQPLLSAAPAPVASAVTSTLNGTANNAFSALPEVTRVTPGRNASGVMPDASFVLRFSEPMQRQQVEDNFCVMAYNHRRLSVDTDNGLETPDADTVWGTTQIHISEQAGVLPGLPIWDKQAFHIFWNADDTEVTFSFKDGLALPTDKDSNLAPDYRVIFLSPHDYQREIQAKDGDRRARGHFKLTDGPFEDSYKFSVQTDTRAPEVQHLQAQTAETGGIYGDALRLRFDKRMVLYTLGRVIAGGMRDRGVGVPESWREAPAGYPGNQGNASARQAARNYFVQITPAGYPFPTFEGSWYDLGGSAFYDPADATGQTVLLTALPGSNLYRPGDQVRVTVAESVLDPAGNPIKALVRSTAATAG